MLFERFYRPGNPPPKPPRPPIPFMRFIILSMTPKERENPDIIGASRKKRIAAGAGVRVEDVNKLLKSFDQMRKLIRQFSGPGAGKKLKRMGRMGGFGGGFPGF